MIKADHLRSVARSVTPPLIYDAAKSLWRAWRTTPFSPKTSHRPQGAPLAVQPPETLDGYQIDPLVDVVYAKTKALRGRNISDMPGAERTLLAVAFAAARTGSSPLRVLDFGGACGFHHLASMPLGIFTRWAVVESAAMARRAADLASDGLKFFSDIEEARQWLGEIDLLHSSSTLQYVSEPCLMLTKLVALSPSTIVWSRMALTDGPSSKSVQTSKLSDNGPGAMPDGFTDALVTYPITRLSRPEFMAAHKGYDLVVEFGEPSVGFVFVRKRAAH